MARLPLEELWLAEAPKPSWIIPQIMVEGQMLVMAGDAGVGKSFLALTWAHHLATGTPILETQVPPQRVLYFNEENSWWDMREYVRWARFSMNGISETVLVDNLRVEQMTLQQSPHWYLALRQVIAEHQPRLIVIDTATPACGIVDEDDNGEANVAIRHLRQGLMAGAPGCGMLILKHAKIIAKGEDRTIRGAKMWKGACDGLIFHTKAAGRPRMDGLHSTYLWPEKTRAFGLRDRILITPQKMTDSAGNVGILLASFGAGK